MLKQESGNLMMCSSCLVRCANEHHGTCCPLERLCRCPAPVILCIYIGTLCQKKFNYFFATRLISGFKKFECKEC